MDDFITAALNQIAKRADDVGKKAWWYRFFFWFPKIGMIASGLVGAGLSHFKHTDLAVLVSALTAALASFDALNFAANLPLHEHAESVLRVFVEHARLRHASERARNGGISRGTHDEFMRRIEDLGNDLRTCL